MIDFESEMARRHEAFEAQIKAAEEARQRLDEQKELEIIGFVKGLEHAFDDLSKAESIYSHENGYKVSYDDRFIPEAVSKAAYYYEKLSSYQQTIFCRETGKVLGYRLECLIDRSDAPYMFNFYFSRVPVSRVPEDAKA